MALTTKLARKALNKADQRHLNGIFVNSMADFMSNVERMRKAHAEHEAKRPGCSVFSGWCESCWVIAKKLGIPTV